MALYFNLLDEAVFHGQIVPALTASWQRRSFAPCRPLADSLRTAIEAFRLNCYAGAEEPLLSRVGAGLSFDRHIWRLMVGEVLMIAAAEVPEIETAPDSLCCLLEPHRYLEGTVPRERFAPIQQAHFGSRDLTFGTAVYRPDQAGWNDSIDVARLADYLAGLDPEHWHIGNLAALTELQDDEERADELEFAREWFPALCGLYRRARERNQVVVCEVL